MAQEDVRLAELSRSIDARELGRRIRNARVAAGLTQAALAGGEVTPAYISRIEDGQRRPEFVLLGRLAERMDLSLEDLLAEAPSFGQLELDLAVDHAELALLGGEATKALEAADAALAKISRGVEGDALRRRCAMIRAGALEATGDLDGAILQLEDIAQAPEGSAAWLRSLISLSRCYQEVGEFDRAIAVEETAAESIASLGLEGLTESIQLSVTVAYAYVRRGDLDRAMRICRQAIERADTVGSPIAKASAYWNASLIESRNGASQLALDLARKALHHFESGEDGRNLARLRGQVAELQLQTDPPDAHGAIATLEQSLRELEWSSASPVDRACQLETRARAHLLLGDSESARADIELCLEILPPHALSKLASASVGLAEIEMYTGNGVRAREALLSAVRILTAAGADREVAQLWFGLATHLRSVGETDAALEAFERAGASTGLRVRSVHGSPTVHRQ